MSRVARKFGHPMQTPAILSVFAAYSLHSEGWSEVYSRTEASKLRFSGGRPWGPAAEKERAESILSSRVDSVFYAGLRASSSS